MSDETCFNIPKLVADGSNWVVYCDQMIWAMGLCILSDHLTNITMPQTYLPGAINGVPLANQWAIGKATVKQAITASMPDSIFNCIKGSTHAKDAWDALRALFEGRMQMIVVDLCWQLQTLKCREEDNVCTHFETIANLHKQLAAMGKSIPDEEYASILLGSLPTAYDATTSAMSTTASLTNTDLTPNTVIWLVTNEYNQRVLKNGRSKEPQDEALAADASQKGKGKPKKDIECFNCKKCGHMKADCWAKGGGKEGQGLKRKHQEGTATADQQAQQDIKAWAAIKQISDQDKDQSNFICKPWTESELYDSGALCHMSPFCHQFVSYRPITPCPIMAADKRLFFANGVGDLWIRVPNGKSFTPVILHDMLYAPNMALTVVSISHITKAGFAISFEGNTCKISNDKGNVVGKIPSNANGLYWVEHVCSASQADEVIDIHTLHCRLGHVAADSIHTLIRSQAIQGISLIDDGQPIYCESCKYTKATRKAIKKEREGVLASTFGEEIHSNVWGPLLLQTIGGRCYYITFTDDHSHFTHTQLLRSKDEALQAYKDFATWAQTQRGVKIKRLRSDCGGEYTSADFNQYLKEQGTERWLTMHDTPQHNRVAKSLNRCLLECMHAVLHHSGLPKHLWGEATLFTTWLKNRTSMRALGNVTLYKWLHGQKPNLAGVPEGGQRMWVHTDAGSKLDGRAVEGHWVGYDRNSTYAHRIYWPSKNSVSVERNVRFASTTVTVYNALLPTNKPGKTPSITAPPPPPSLPPALPPVPALAPPQPQDIALPPSDAEDNDDEDVEDQLDLAPLGRFQLTPSMGKSKTTRQSTADGSPGYTQATWASTRKSRPLDYKK